MKKTALKTLMGNVRNALLTVAVAAMGIAVSAPAASAQEAPLPEKWMEVPASDPDDPYVIENSPNAKIYYYFTNGSVINHVLGNVIQNGSVLGQVRYEPSALFKNMCQASVANTAALQSLTPGVFTIEIFEVEYVVGGETFLHSDAANPIDVLTYNMAGKNGTLVSENQLSQILSYYPANSTDGVKTYTFSNALSPDNIHVIFDYGLSDQYYIYDLPWTLTDGGKTIEIDLRGVCHNADVLAQGNTFYDENGNPVEDPTEISIEISGLVCTDGSRIETLAVSPDGLHSTTLTGRLRQTFPYRDITFDTPVLSMAQFYAASAPETKYNSINENADMMVVNVSHAEVIASCDLTFYFNGTSVTIPNEEIVKSGIQYTVALPQEVRFCGTEDIEIGLDNVVYVQEDGVEHIIERLSLKNFTKEIQSVAELLGLSQNAAVILNIEEGLKITYANELGYIFGEDSTAGVQITTMDYSMPFEQGVLVKGTIYGTYIGSGIFMVNADKGNYTQSPVNVATGEILKSADEIVAGNYDNRLVTLVANPSMPLVYDEETGYVMVGETVVVVTDMLDEDFEIPAQINNVTGVVWPMDFGGQYGIIVRSADDFNQDIVTDLVCENISQVLALDSNTEAVLQLNGAKITYANEMFGGSIIDDGNAAMWISYSNGDMFSAQGKAITGMIHGVIVNAGIPMFVVDAEYDAFDEADADVSTGVEIGLDEIANESNLYRLVTFYNTPETPFTIDPYKGITIGNAVAGVDYFGVLDEIDYEFPANIVSFTGIIMPNGVAMYDEDDETEQQPVLVALRGVDDVVAGNGVVDLTGDGKIDSADLGVVINMIVGTVVSTDTADFNHDGRVDSIDLGAVINYIIGNYIIGN